MCAERIASRAWLLAVALGVGAAAAAVAQTEKPLGQPSTLALESTGETVRVREGMRVRERPDATSGVLLTIDFDGELPLVGKSDGWDKVQAGELVGWIERGDTGAATEAAPAAAAAPPPPAPDRTRRQQRRELALSILEPAAERLRTGPFELVTDARRRGLPARLGSIAGELAAAYRARYGLEPRLEATPWTVAIFAREVQYRRFEESAGDLAGLEAAGHAGRGLAAFFVEGRSLTELEAILVHELTHLLNRTLLPADVPAWLEEGMANDLAYCRLDGDGRLDLGTLAGSRRIHEGARFGGRGGVRVERTLYSIGPAASLDLVRRHAAARTLVPLTTLLDLPWGAFVDPRGRELRYVQSAFWVRYLLDGDARTAAAFRAFLAAAAAGERAHAAALAAHLERPWTELEAAFRRWLLDQVPAL